ncbi:hypothetical protein ACFZBM_01700 [Streptomyces lavendulae]|uniref:Uncharacterized protein n=1 Tax=Streptomyces lavendulae subsp. lavendulae TaxID=58340 RepID=A0A2K8P8X7_STRLA|nr:hypothetical protein SLAV_06470 [Streptomyces lavendulae subsp. lavendulae]QUQ53034.1 hypothetical protein SLLC_04485 [Streptomyces lavendulae subsp. lavendulae]
MPHVAPNNGLQVPVLGFGVHQLPPERTERAVTDALVAGGSRAGAASLRIPPARRMA